jgi:hypothetical protein
VIKLVDEALRAMDGTEKEKLAVLNEIARTELK